MMGVFEALDVLLSNVFFCRRVIQRLGGGRGFHNFVPVLEGDGPKIAPPGDIFEQPPGETN